MSDLRFVAVCVLFAFVAGCERGSVSPDMATVSRGECEIKAKIAADAIDLQARHQRDLQECIRERDRVLERCER